MMTVNVLMIILKSWFGMFFYFFYSSQQHKSRSTHTPSANVKIRDSDMQYRGD